MARYVGVLPSASRNADTNSPIIVNHGNYQALHLMIDITTGSPNLIVTVQGRDAGIQKLYNLLQSTTINSGTTILKVGPGLTPVANLIVNDYMPYEWLVAVTQSGGVDVTYSVGASLI